MNKKTKEILRDVFSYVPQAHVVAMVKSSISPQELAQQILQASSLRSLDQDQQDAIIALMSMDKTQREMLAGQIIGMGISKASPGFFKKVLFFVTLGRMGAW